MLPKTQLVPDLFPEKIERYERLCAQRRDITRKISDLLRDAPMVPRPQWGPCTRCGATWRGKWVRRKPRCCAKCGNLYWDQPYSSPEAEEAAKRIKDERARQRGARAFTVGAQREEIANAFEVLHRHGITIPVPSFPSVPRPVGVTGLTPPPISVLESVSHAGGSGVAVTSASVVGAQQVGDHPLTEVPDEEVHIEREPEDAETAGEDVPEAPGCCDRPVIIDGACLNCGAGLERKVTIDVHDNE